MFNADETGLFWKMLPDTTHVVKNQTFSGGKRSKDRIKILVTVSANGEKEPLLVIGKSKQPRCFRNNTIPFEYKFNKKAWMTAEIFKSFLMKLDRKMIQQNRKIALILDNCTAHPTDIRELQNNKMYFLPPNTTSYIQPLDAGIIKNLKHHYRRFLVRRKIDTIENGVPFYIDLLQSLLFLKTAWSKVTCTTIEKCFKHTGFKSVKSSDKEKLFRILRN